ncbi:rhamnogalacturonan acetylesterase [Alteromonas pelagimontana]|uniref:Rhamnogalacturonan acetylesterase n=2 Tax=Alteromonas pelagimontana TaxID=1858656 RepID=A0A6M4MI92_9ALTE|nr:rhamnogalacturonan acetylesterase [Alteromonas pelagimontana]
MFKPLIVVVLFFCTYVQAQDLTPVTLHLVGDSTMANKPNLAYPERGWGHLLPHFVSPELEIRNYATNGRSTRSFIDEGRWSSVLSEIKEGDYVLIQFGHNDQKKEDPVRYASPDKDYPAFLKRYIEEARTKGATPMLASSICRRHFSSDGKLERTLLEYAAAAKKVAKAEDVAFFPLNEKTCALLAETGDEESQKFFLQVPPDLYTRYPEGKIDNTHLNVIGASKVAQLFVRELKAQNHPLANYVYRETL